MIINLFRKQYMTSLELPTKVLGQFWITDITDGVEEKIIAVEGIDNQWILKLNKKYHFDDLSIKSVVLNEMKIYPLKDEKKEPLFVYVEKRFEKTVYQKYMLKNMNITIGRSPENIVQIDNMLVSSCHCKITLDNGEWILKDLNSSNGTFLNQVRCTSQKLNPGDCIYILGTKIVFGKDYISIGINEGVQVDETRLERISFPRLQFKENEESIEHSYFYQSPRMKRDIQQRVFKVDSPPDNQIGEELPLMMVIGPSVTMGIASLSTGIFAISNAISTGNISSALPSIIMSFSMLLGTVMWPLITKQYEKKRKHEKESLRQKKYGEYLDQLEKDIAVEIENQKEILCENSPSAEACITSIDNIERRLWNRTMKQNDFLQIRLGMGKKKLDAKFIYSEKKFSLVEDSLKDRLYSICEKEKFVRDVPITISLFDNYISGIIGRKDCTEKVIKNIIAQLTSFYSYDEMKLVFLYDKQDVQFDFVKWIPHVFDDNKRNRFIAKDKMEMKELSSYFENIISYRKNMNSNDMEEELPYYVIFVLDKELGSKFDTIKSLEKINENIHFSVINVCEEIKDLPKACKSVIEVSSLSGNIYDLSDLTGKKVVFKPDLFDIDCMDMSKKLSNISLDFSENEKLPKVVPFLQMYQVGKIEHLNPLTRWKENDPTITLEAPVGVDVQGDLFKLDLHEKYHGPHGLIAGMTGSGKSEFIITYILSMALNYHPEEVSFILIDYKGGGMAKAFEKLPHVAGIITNLDGASVNRSLVSIDSELKRRQSIFAATGLSNLNIYKYQKLYREGKVKEPLSHLFIISDEFAELKTQQPEFMSQLVSTARIGRSLGVHLILATQKPSGVVDDQIWSNSRFRVCLKVQERADSMDMLKRPEAAELVETGRFYLQVGYNEMFEIGQSAWSGAPYYPSDRVIKEIDNSVVVIDTTGREIAKGAVDYHKNVNKEARKQLDEITSFLAELAEEENIHIRPIWLEPMKERIYYIDLMSQYTFHRKDNEITAIIGEYDDPANQKQNLFTLPISELKNIAIYESSGNGITMMLNSIVYSLCNHYTPEEVNLYVLDFSGGVLKCFDPAPHVGDVILQDEEEKVGNLLKMLKEEIVNRRKKFANFSGDIKIYNVNHSQKECEIVVIINNITAFNEMYENEEDQLTYLIREGGKYGIYFIVTASSVNGIRYRMQQNFASQIALRLNDDSDYLAIIGKTDGLYPVDYDGRGLAKIDGEIYEFQTAIAVGKENAYKEIEKVSKALSTKYESKAKRIPVLPEVVNKELLLPYYNGDLNVPLGIDYSSLEVVKYDFSKNYINCILSSYQKNEKIVQGLLSIISKQYDMYVLDINKNGYKEVEKGFYTIKNCEIAIDELFEIVVQRNNTYKESDCSEKVAESFTPLILSLNSFSELYHSLNEESCEKLDLILEKGSVDYKINIIISDNTALSSFTFKPWFKSKINTNEFIWIGDGISEQYHFQNPKKGSFIHDTVEKDSGYVVSTQNINKLKFIYEEDKNE